MTSAESSDSRPEPAPASSLPFAAPDQGYVATPAPWPATTGAPTPGAPTPGAPTAGSVTPGAGTPSPTTPEATPSGPYPPALAYPYPYPVTGQPAGGYAGYGAPAGQYYPGYPYPVLPQQRTNGLAIGSMVVSLVSLGTLACYGVGVLLAPVGAILGHVARRQINQRGEGGAGMALTGIIVGWITTGLGLLFIAGFILLVLYLPETNTGSNNDVFDMLRLAVAALRYAGPGSG